ncbi:MAG: SRPBCC domain-containing protein [Gammaproteobacteria bacterium]
MRKELYTEIEIAADAGRVWDVLTDFARFPEWNPFIRSIQGEREIGARLSVRIEPPGGRPMAFRPMVVTVRPRGELGWIGRLGVPGLFDGEHSFRIDPLTGGRVNFIQREVFTGVLVPLVWRALNRRVRAGFEAMNAALRARAEGAGEQ